LWQIVTPASEDAWNLAVPRSTIKASGALAEQVAKLQLPGYAIHGLVDDQWKSQTY